MRFNPIRPTTIPVETQETSPQLPSPNSQQPITASIRQILHTKRNAPVWVVQLSQRVERAQYKRLAALARNTGGYYSSFGPAEHHGFLFFEEQKAIAFAMLTDGTPSNSHLPSPISHLPTPIPVPVAPAAAPLPPMPEWRARLLRRPLST